MDFFADLTDERTKMAVQQVSAQLSRSIYAAIIMLAITIRYCCCGYGSHSQDGACPDEGTNEKCAQFRSRRLYYPEPITSQGVLELQALGQTFNSMAKNIEEDIFHREKIQKELEIANVKAEDSTRAKSLFLANGQGIDQ